MEVKWLTESDIASFIFLHYPDRMSMEECRERLELDIYEWSMKYEKHGPIDDFDIKDDGSAVPNGKTIDINEPVISPYYLESLILDRRIEEIRKMSAEQKKKELDAFWKERAERIKDKLK